MIWRVCIRTFAAKWKTNKTNSTDNRFTVTERHYVQFNQHKSITQVLSPNTHCKSLIQMNSIVRLIQSYPENTVMKLKMIQLWICSQLGNFSAKLSYCNPQIYKQFIFAHVVLVSAQFPGVGSKRKKHMITQFHPTNQILRSNMVCFLISEQHPSAMT